MLGTSKGTAKVVFADTKSVKNGFLSYFILLNGVTRPGKNGDTVTDYSRLPSTYWSDTDPGIKSGDEVEIEFHVAENKWFVQYRVAANVLRDKPKEAFEQVQKQSRDAYNLLKDPESKKQPPSPLELRITSIRKLEQAGTAKPVASTNPVEDSDLPF